MLFESQVSNTSKRPTRTQHGARWSSIFVARSVCALCVPFTCQCCLLLLRIKRKQAALPAQVEARAFARWGGDEGLDQEILRRFELQKETKVKRQAKKIQVCLGVRECVRMYACMRVCMRVCACGCVKWLVIFQRRVGIYWCTCNYTMQLYHLTLTEARAPVRMHVLMHSHHAYIQMQHVHTTLFAQQLRKSTITSTWYHKRKEHTHVFAPGEVCLLVHGVCA